MTSFLEVKERLLANPAVRAEYDRLGPIYDLMRLMAGTRRETGLTQKDLAARMETTQSVIARLENGRHIPSLDLLTGYAAALGRRVNIIFVPAE